MNVRVPYGRTTLTASLPDHFAVDVIETPATPPAVDPQGVICSALDNLLGNLKWAGFSGARSVAIAINDKTRPVPHQLLLPPLLERLASIGIPDQAIKFFIAVGTHPPMKQDEYSAILPAELLERFRIISHDSEDNNQLIDLGTTKRGTPILSNRAYVTSDLKIVVGNIEPHQFVGFSGGAKAQPLGYRRWKLSTPTIPS